MKDMTGSEVSLQIIVSFLSLTPEVTSITRGCSFNKHNVGKIFKYLYDVIMRKAWSRTCL
jgi:hypothetical protein